MAIAAAAATTTAIAPKYSFVRRNNKIGISETPIYFHQLYCHLHAGRHNFLQDEFELLIPSDMEPLLKWQAGSRSACKLSLKLHLDAGSVPRRVNTELAFNKTLQHQ